MANNYAQFAECISDLTPEETEWIEAVLGFDPDEHESITDEQTRAALAGMLGCSMKELEPVNDIEDWPGFDGRVLDGDLLLEDNGEHFDLEALLVFVLAFIRRWRPDFVYTMTWAATCSKHRTGEFGGGWAMVSKDIIKVDNTWSAAEAAVEDYKRDHDYNV